MHYVTLSDFFIGQTEVTQELWSAIMDSVPSRFQNDPTNPVENVSWEDCQLFIAKLNALTGATFRLPTEAEWEYAARGGKNAQRKLYAGSDNPDEVVWYRDNSLGSSHPVGLKKSNELGLYDMGGNVWEWCADWYGAYSSISQINPVGPDSSTTNRRVVRGGSWAYDANNCRVTVRNGQVETDKKVDIGFRLAL
jgi:formylglycine-generating enzyme required for sulfatase activity